MDQRLPEPAVTDWRGLCEELVEELNALSAHLEGTTPLETVLSGLRAWNRARTALAQPEPEGRPAPAPAEGEVAELVWELRQEADLQDVYYTSPEVLRRAADLLERQAAPVPVPVSERLPGVGDCDGEGRCWFWRTDGADEFWELVVPLSNIHEFNLTAQWKYTHWLSYPSLPLPDQE